MAEKKEAKSILPVFSGSIVEASEVISGFVGTFPASTKYRKGVADAVLHDVVSTRQLHELQNTTPHSIFTTTAHHFLIDALEYQLST